MAGISCGFGRRYDAEKNRCKLNVPTCIGQAATTGLSTGITTGPQNGLIAAAAKYAGCKALEGVEKVDAGAPREYEPSTQKLSQFDSTPQIPIANNEPYYQEPDPVLDDEFDSWQTEDELVTVDDVDYDFKTDFDVHPS